MYCIYEGHQQEPIIGYCIQKCCDKSRPFCYFCIRDEKHHDHMKETKSFQELKQWIEGGRSANADVLTRLQNLIKNVERIMQKVVRQCPDTQITQMTNQQLTDCIECHINIFLIGSKIKTPLTIANQKIEEILKILIKEETINLNQSNSAENKTNDKVIEMVQPKILNSIQNQVSLQTPFQKLQQDKEKSENGGKSILEDASNKNNEKLSGSKVNCGRQSQKGEGILKKITEHYESTIAEFKDNPNSYTIFSKKQTNIDIFAQGRKAKNDVKGGFCICDPSFNWYKCYTLRFFIHNLNNFSTVHIGVCFRNQASNPDLSHIGHGFYLINNFGQVFSHHDKFINNSKKEFNIQQNDEIQLEIQHRNIKWWNKRSDEIYNMDICQSNYSLLPCVGLYYAEVEVKDYIQKTRKSGIFIF